MLCRRHHKGGASQANEAAAQQFIQADAALRRGLIQVLAVMAMRSPILTLSDHIAASAFKIAPERGDELDQVRHAENLELLFVDQPGFTFSVNTVTHEMKTSTATLEYLWCSINAHLVLYRIYCEAQKSGVEHLDTGANPDCVAALKLLEWAENNLENSGKEPWPAELPQPSYDANESGISVSDELFLCAVAWIIHHEIAHVRMGHTHVHTNHSVQDEKQADIEATRWILDQSSVEGESRKRTIGIAAAILAMQGISEKRHYSPLSTHPETFERIDYCMSEAKIEDDDEIFAFASVIMQVQLWYRGIRVAHEGDTFRDTFSSYLVEFARQ